VAAGYSAEVLCALKQAPTWMLKSLTWPHSVLGLLVAGDVVAAKAHLSGERKWTLSGPADWEAAGVYWATFFEDRNMARVCFEKASTSHWQCSKPDQASMAWNWLKLCGDVDCALRCLYADIDNGPTMGTVDPFAWHPLIAHADAWMTLFDRKDWAARYLEYAATAGAAEDVGRLFPVAMAWSCILRDDRRAATEAELAMGNKHESLMFASLYWYCIADDREKAKQCLWSKEWSDYPSARFRLELAQCMAMFRGFGDSDLSLRHAEALIDEVTREKQTNILVRCAAAELWSSVAGAGAENLLHVAADQAEETCELFDIAETWRRLAHLPADSRLAGACKVLEQAEEIAANYIDYYFCAHSWKTIVGDEASSERCLLKGEACACNPQGIALLARGWVELLGRPARSRKLVLEKSRTILPKDSTL